MTDFNKYLTERYQDQVAWYDKKSITNKKFAQRMQITVITLAAVVPVLAALQYKWLTIAASATVAAMAGILTYGKYEELWHNYRTICETLRKEKYQYDFKIGEYEHSTEPQKLFIQRVESLISRENTDWGYIINRNTEKKRGPDKCK